MITPLEMNLEMEDFIPCIYNKCSPNYYGLLFGKKIIRESNGFLDSTPHSMDNGDFYFYSNEFLKLFLVKLKFPIKEKRVITELPIFETGNHLISTFFVSLMLMITLPLVIILFQKTLLPKKVSSFNLNERNNTFQ